MLQKVTIGLVIGFFVSAGLDAAVFSSGPALGKESTVLNVYFTLSEPGDVEIAVLDGSGNVVRHLAAGYLGGSKTPPPPLSAGLSQAVPWYYRDDDGGTVNPSGCKVRVRLGLTPEHNYTISTAGINGKHGMGYIAPDEPYIRSDHPILNLMYNKPLGGHTPPGLEVDYNRATDQLYVKVYVANSSLYHIFNGADGSLAGTANFGKALPRMQWGEVDISPDGQRAYYLSAQNHLGRYTPSGTYVPFSDADSGHVTTLPSGFQQTRGLDVGPDGNIYVLHYETFREWEQCVVSVVDSQGKVIKPAFIKPFNPAMRKTASGIRVDRDGNIFVGVYVQPTLIPPDVQPLLAAGGAGNDKYKEGWWANQMYGSIVKYGPDGSYKWLLHSFSPILNHSSNLTECCCRVGRFSVDEYGRVFFPDGFRMSVCAVDNGGNLINRWHSHTLGGTKNLAFPEMVIYGKEQIYVSDFLNNQIANFKLTYDHENTLEVDQAGIEDSKVMAVGLDLDNTPNPFNPTTEVFYNVPAFIDGQRLTLAVYDVQSRLVRTLVDRTHEQGRFSVRWNGRDRTGRSVASGVYLCVLETGALRIQKRMTVAR